MSGETSRSARKAQERDRIYASNNPRANSPRGVDLLNQGHGERAPQLEKRRANPRVNTDHIYATQEIASGVGGKPAKAKVKALPPADPAKFEFKSIDDAPAYLQWLRAVNRPEVTVIASDSGLARLARDRYAAAAEAGLAPQMQVTVLTPKQAAAIASAPKASKPKLSVPEATEIVTDWSRATSAKEVEDAPPLMDDQAAEVASRIADAIVATDDSGTVADDDLAGIMPTGVAADPETDDDPEPEIPSYPASEPEPETEPTAPSTDEDSFERPEIAPPAVDEPAAEAVAEPTPATTPTRKRKRGK
jgi:hypothetical protein